MSAKTAVSGDTALSALTVFADSDAGAKILHTTDARQIAAELALVGVRFEQWNASAPVKAGDTPEQVLRAYRVDIDKLVNEEGYQTVDVISLDATDNPEVRAKVPELREKFL